MVILLKKKEKSGESSINTRTVANNFGSTIFHLPTIEMILEINRDNF